MWDSEISSRSSLLKLGLWEIPIAEWVDEFSNVGSPYNGCDLAIDDSAGAEFIFLQIPSWYEFAVFNNIPSVRSKLVSQPEIYLFFFRALIADHRKYYLFQTYLGLILYCACINIIPYQTGNLQVFAPLNFATLIPLQPVEPLRGQTFLQPRFRNQTNYSTVADINI